MQSIGFGPKVRQCRAICHDGVELLGLISDPTDPRLPTLVFVPGMFDNAYQQPVNQLLAERGFNSGFAVALTNNRGQDYYAYQRVFADPQSPSDYSWKLFGSSFERVADGPLDIESWISAVHPDGASNGVILIGHSHGAIKVANYMFANQDDQRVVAAALLSPSDDIGAQKVKLDDRFDEAVAVAKKLVDRGDETSYMPDWVFSSPISAGTYLEAFGPASPLRSFALHDPSSSPLTREAKLWSVPTLIVYGEADSAPGKMSPADGLNIIDQKILSGAGPRKTAVVPGADHHYRRRENQLIDVVLDWVGESI